MRLQVRCPGAEEPRGHLCWKNPSTAPSATGYYDGACPICSREVAQYRKVQRADRLHFVAVTACDAKDLGPSLACPTPRLWRGFMSCAPMAAWRPVLPPSPKSGSNSRSLLGQAGSQRRQSGFLSLRSDTARSCAFGYGGRNHHRTLGIGIEPWQCRLGNPTSPQYRQLHGPCRIEPPPGCSLYDRRIPLIGRLLAKVKPRREHAVSYRGGASRESRSRRAQEWRAVQ